mmetsp:Transcript_111502/g.314834  ORF Transcript_111502/g.314834 Transcript_111502/m.314834 type:complete len:486 (+) Transcript_111502:72-1529(+)
MSKTPDSRVPYQELKTDGATYNQALLELAERFAQDGQISYSEAKQLWEYTSGVHELSNEIRKRTLQLTMEVFNYTDRAASVMDELMNGARTTSYYKQVDGARYDRELLEMAERSASDGQVSLQEAEALWEQAMDGGKVTDVERLTLQHSLSIHKYTVPAAEFLKRMLRYGSTKVLRRPHVKVRWVWAKRRGSQFPAFPIVLPKKDHRFTLVLCHPMGWGGGFYLGRGALVQDFLLNSRLIRDHCKIVCPGGKKQKDWKMWFRYRGKDTGGTRECHAQLVNRGDIEQAGAFVSDIISAESRLLGSTDRVAISGYSQGGCLSLAVGLELPYPVGLVISQRGMLMQHTLDDYSRRGPEQKPPQHFLLTAGGRDNIYLPTNQTEAKKWLEKHGMRVSFKLFDELNHGDHHKGEMSLIRNACVRTFLEADARTKPPPVEKSAQTTLKRAPSKHWPKASKALKRPKLSNVPVGTPGGLRPKAGEGSAANKR